MAEVVVEAVAAAEVVVEAVAVAEVVVVQVVAEVHSVLAMMLQREQKCMLDILVANIHIHVKLFIHIKHFEESFLVTNKTNFILLTEMANTTNKFPHDTWQIPKVVDQKDIILIWIFCDNVQLRIFHGGP